MLGRGSHRGRGQPIRPRVSERYIDMSSDIFPRNRRSRSPIDRVRSPINRVRSPIMHVRSPVTRHRSPINRGRSPMNRVRSPINRGRSPGNRGRSPINRGRSPVNRGRSPVNRGRSPVNRGRSPVIRGRSPLNRGRSPGRFNEKRSTNRSFERPRSRERSHPDKSKNRNSPLARRSRGRSPVKHDNEKNWQPSLEWTDPSEIRNVRYEPPPIVNKRMSTSPISEEEKGYLRREPPSPPKVIKEPDDRLNRLEKMVEILVTKGVPNAIETIPDVDVSSSNGIPEFVPRNMRFTTSMWLNRIEADCIDKNMDEKQSIQFLISRMTGVMKAWFNTFSGYDFSWTELKMLIINTFPDNNDFAVTLRRLVDRKKEHVESMTNYFFSKLYLIEACKISGTNAVSCLIDGLDPQLQLEVRENNFLTPESLYTIFLSRFCNEDNYRSVDSKRTLRMNDEPSKQPEYGRPVEPYTPKNLPIDDVRRTLKNKKKRATCYACKEPGHISIDCPVLNKVRRKKTLLSVSDWAEFEKCYFKDCVVNGEPILGLLDSGCNMVLMKQEVAEYLHLQTRSSSAEVSGIGDSLIKALGETDVQLKVDEVSSQVSVVIVPNTAIDVPMLIGQPIMNHEDHVTIIEKNKLTVVDKKNLPVCINLA